MLCSRVTLSSRSHENFISHRNTGNRFSRRTEKISATRRSLQLARRCSFRRTVSQGRTSQRTAEIGAPRKESDARTHRTPKALRAKSIGPAALFRDSFRSARASSRRFHPQPIQLIPSNSRCQGTSNDIARVPSAATASRVPRGAMNDGSNPSLSADLSRRR